MKFIKKHKNCIKATAFLLVLCILLYIVTGLVTVNSDNMEYQWMSGIYEQKKDTLDAVYIGSSSCFAFWNSNIAWSQYGITVYPYSCSYQPLIAAEYLIKEARKTQSDAVYVVSINTLGDEGVDDVAMHWLVDYMPLSKNKIELTDYLCDLNELSFSDRLEYYLPLIRYHDVWSRLTPTNFSTKNNGLKGANTYRWHFEDVLDISANYLTSDGNAPLPEYVDSALDSLLDYCDDNKLRVVFVAAPRAEKDIHTVCRINTVADIIEERGYPVLDFINGRETLNIFTDTDYYNNTHTNIHGALKFTHYLSDYLIDRFGFEDKRKDLNYNDWADSYEQYSKLITPHALSFEIENAKRDYTLSAPESFNAWPGSDRITVSWGITENADGYDVYKKTADGAWSLLLEDANEYYVVDMDVVANTVYSYAVVPYRTENGQKVYGKYQYGGIKAATV